MIPSCEYSERPRHAHAPDSDDSEGGIVFFSDARPAVRALPDGGSGGPARRRPRGSAPRDSSTRSAVCSPVSCGIRVGSRPSRRARRRARRTRARRHFFRWRSLHTATEDKSFFSSARASATTRRRTHPLTFSSRSVVFPLAVVRFTTSASARRSLARRSARSTRGTSLRSWAATTSRASA